MKKNSILLLILLFFSLSQTATLAQAQLSLTQSDAKELKKYLMGTRKSMEKLNRSIVKTNHKYIKKYKRFERKYFNKLCKTDPLKADIFAASYDYTLLDSPQSIKNGNRAKSKSSYYFDTLKIVTHYLYHDSISLIKEINSENLNCSKELDSSLNQSNKLQAYFRKQKTFLKNSTGINSTAQKELLEIDKLNYYYSSSISNRISHFDKKVLLLNTNEAYSKILNTPEFNDYFKKNSKLAKFSSLADLNSQNIKGSQTLVQTEEQIANQFSTMEDAISDQFVNKTLSGNFPMVELKSLSSMSNLADMPSFSPNQLKSLKTSERLSYRANWQFCEFSNFYPGKLNLDLATGYEFIKGNIFGGGINYFTDLGSSWNHIKFSTRGYGLNVFYEYKLIQSIYLNVIYERNYFTDSIHIEQNAYHLVNEKKNVHSAWQNSLLFGVKVKQRVRGVKGFATMSFYYDLLNKKRYAPATPFIYKMGWEW